MATYSRNFAFTAALVLADPSIACAQEVEVNVAQSTEPIKVGRSGLISDIQRTPQELTYIFRYPFDETAAFSKYALGVGLLIALDKPITKAWQNHVESALSDFKVPNAPGVFRTLGEGGTDGWLLMGIAGTYLGGVVTGDTNNQRVGIAATKSIAYSVLISQLFLKSLTGRKRPLASLSSGTPDGTYTNNPYDFGNPRRPTYSANQLNSSFPSFHFTAWFAAAKVYQQAYDNYWAPYSVLAVGLASNVKGHHHWVSDMTAGGLIGTGIGWVVSKNYFTADENVSLRVSLIGGPRLDISKRF